MPPFFFFLRKYIESNDKPNQSNHSPVPPLKNLSWVLLVPKMLLLTFFSLSKSSLLSPLGFSSSTTPSEEETSQTGLLMKLTGEVHILLSLQSAASICKQTNSYCQFDCSTYCCSSFSGCTKRLHVWSPLMLPCSLLLTFTRRFT